MNIESYIEKIRSEWGKFIILAVIGLFLLIWGSSYIYIDPEAAGNLVAVRIPKIAMNVAALCGITWLFDLVTPGSFLKAVATNAYASAILLVGLVFGLALVIM